MNSLEFVDELENSLGQLLAGLDNLELIESESSNQLEMAHLLKIALKNEIEATELAAHWLTTTQELDVKLGFARQGGDEAKHYRLIEKRLAAMQVDLRDFNPLAAGYSKLFEYLKGLPDTISRLAAGQFTREGIAVKRNEQFIRFCDMRGDRETANLYREIIQPDERYHHLLGKEMLQKYAVSEQHQQSARVAAQQTILIAEELRGIAASKTGIRQIPGC
jgi:uncharacterized ferritin-like protein (DUF455 family)